MIRPCDLNNRISRPELPESWGMKNGVRQSDLICAENVGNYKLARLTVE